jgi:hypothetical protein
MRYIFQKTINIWRTLWGKSTNSINTPNKVNKGKYRRKGGFKFGSGYSRVSYNESKINTLFLFVIIYVVIGIALYQLLE